LLAHKLFHKKPGDICTDEIRQKRFEQALDAMKAIGASAGIFFGYDSIKEPENSGRRENSISAASGIISLLKPQRIFVPQPCDQHLTHLLSTYIFASAATAAKTSAELLGYPVWAPAPYDEPTLKEFVMQEHVDAMRKAVRTHLTETVKDYAGAVEAMLRYDAIMCSNTPDAPENRYCLRLMRLNHLIGRSRGGIVRIIGSYVQDEKRKAEFDSQFDVK
jgi:LmbE family N-acetylglucosaminyl deacetylase